MSTELSFPQFILVLGCLILATYIGALLLASVIDRGKNPKTQTIRFNIPGKRTKKLVRTKVDIDVGVADILITFCDGRTFTSKIYGNFYPNANEGNDEWVCGRRVGVCEPSVSHHIHSAQQKAHEEVERHRGDQYHSFTNTSEAPTKSMHGQVSTIEILSVSPYIVTFDTAEVVDA